MPVITSYEPFSLQPEYLEANREFLHSLPLENVSQVLDLACGTGTLSELLLEIKPEVRSVQSSRTRTESPQSSCAHTR